MLVVVSALVAALPGALGAGKKSPSATRGSATTMSFLRTAPAPAVLVTPLPGEVSVRSNSLLAIEFFMEGRAAVENARAGEGDVQFRKAIDLDPEFALAHAYLGQSTPGSSGLRELERAAALSKELPPAERLLIEAMLAQRQGAEEAARGLWRQLAEIAPRDWRIQQAWGERLAGDRRWAGAAVALQQAIALNSAAGPAYNTLGYVFLNTGKLEPAIEAFRKYVEAMPREPNARDSLGEALMSAGRLDEAEAAFREAAAISPQFWMAYAGVAQTKFLRGDWGGGRAALAEARKAAPRLSDKLDVDTMLAWSQAASGDVEGALATFRAVEAAAGENLDVTRATAPLQRAIVLNESGRREEAAPLIAEALESARSGKLPGRVSNQLRRSALTLRVDIEAQLGQAAEAAKTAALLEEEARKAPGDGDLRSRADIGRGSAAWARGDFAAAAQAFAQCTELDYACRRRLAEAQQRAGDATGAEATYRKLMTAPRRDAMYLLIRSRIHPAEAIAGIK